MHQIQGMRVNFMSEKVPTEDERVYRCEIGYAERQ